MRVIRTILILALTVVGRSAVADIPIGWIGPLTGNAAVLGVDTVPAIEVAID